MFCKCRQQDLLKKVVEIKPKRQRFSSQSDGNRPSLARSASTDLKSESKPKESEHASLKLDKADGPSTMENPVKSLLGLAYTSSDEDD